MRSHSSRAKDRRRADVWFTLAAVAGVAVLAWVFITMQQLSHDLRTANDARDALASQVQKLGEKPVAGPPGSRGESGKSIVGPQGSPGPSGPPGPIGPVGPPGKEGIKGSTGPAGNSVVGSPGTNGSDGAQGSTGPAGPAGPQGDPGPAGPQGEPGPAGQDGKDGQSCPDGYSMQTPSYDPYAKVCRQDGAPDPSPSNGNNLLSMGLDPSRRQYR